MGPRNGLRALLKNQYQLDRTLGGSKGRPVDRTLGGSKDRPVDRILGGSKDRPVDRILGGSKDRPVCSTEDSVPIGQDTGWVQRPVCVLNRRKNSSRS